MFPMILCNCNAIREDEVRAAARRGCPCPESAYRSLGCEFQCGSCRDDAEELIAVERADLLSVDAIAA
jgi:bacterioferritin-associated ferredoxin